MQNPIIQFLQFQMVAHKRLITKENLKLLALKVVAATYERCSLTTGSKYGDLTFGTLEIRSLSKNGRNQKFDSTAVCICIWVCFVGEKQCITYMRTAI